MRGTWGIFAHNLALGVTELPGDYRKRREQRLEAKKREPLNPLRMRALNEAQKHVGVREDPPGSNRTMFGAWYGWNGVPWCAEGFSYCYVKAGSVSFKAGERYAYVPYIVADARAGRNNP